MATPLHSSLSFLAFSLECDEIALVDLDSDHALDGLSLYSIAPSTPPIYLRLPSVNKWKFYPEDERLDRKSQERLWVLLGKSKSVE